MRDIVVRICHWLLAAMGLAGASSCEEAQNIEVRAEYGVPYSTFQVKCKVVDAETGAAVNGVKLTPGYTYSYKDEDGNVKEGYFPCSGAVETIDGACEIRGNMDISNRGFEELQMMLTDPDPATGGHYRDTIYVVALKKIKDPGKDDGSWNVGTYGADVTVSAKSVK